VDKLLDSFEVVFGKSFRKYFEEQSNKHGYKKLNSYQEVILEFVRDDSKDRDNYHPFVKGLVRSKGRYGAGFSFGYTTKQGAGDGFGRGIINLVEDNGTIKNWGFEHNGDFNSAGDVRSSGGKSLNNAAQLSDFVYQKIGNFEVRKYPDGTMLQTYIHHPNNGKIGVQFSKQTFNWAVAFVEKPKVFIQHVNKEPSENSGVEKEYLVRVKGKLSEEGLRLLNHGLKLDGEALRPAKVSWQNQDQLRFVLKQGKKRQIRRMCELVGLRVANALTAAAGEELRNVRVALLRKGECLAEEQGEVMCDRLGFGGSAVLRLSRLVTMAEERDGFSLSIDFKPGLNRAKLRGRIAREREERPREPLSSSLRALLPAKLVLPVGRRAGTQPIFCPVNG